MPNAPHFNDPEPFFDAEYCFDRAEEARVLAEQINGETSKQTMLMVADDCDRFALKAAARSMEKLAVSRAIGETEKSAPRGHKAAGAGRAYRQRQMC
jgi:hypothetical protein